MDQTGYEIKWGCGQKLAKVDPRSAPDLKIAAPEHSKVRHENTKVKT